METVFYLTSTTKFINAILKIRAIEIFNFTKIDSKSNFHFSMHSIEIGNVNESLSPEQERLARCSWSRGTKCTDDEPAYLYFSSCGANI